MNNKINFPSREQQEEYSSTYPTPRSIVKEALIPQSKKEKTLAQYREELLSLLEKYLNDTSSPEEAKFYKDTIVIAQEGEEDNLLSSITSSYQGVTIHKLIRFLSEELHHQTKKLKALSDGKAYSSESIQLELFAKPEQQFIEESRKKGRPVIKYNPREWAKKIYGDPNPKKQRVDSIKEAIEYLSKFRVYYPLPDEGYFFEPILKKTDLGVVRREGIYEYVQLANFFTIALTEKDNKLIPNTGEGVTYNISISRLKEFSKAIEIKLLNYLEYLYSYANKDIKEKNKKGEIAFHRENIQTLIDKVGEGSYIEENYRNKSKALKNLRIAFQKIEQIGIIKKGTFKEEGNSFIWGWGKLTEKN